MIFDWDDEKADRNLAKHGVSFAEAQTVFDDPLGRIMDDLRKAPPDKLHVSWRSNADHQCAESKQSRAATL